MIRRFCITPLHYLLSTVEPGSGIQRSLSCAKILLGSGADPTITPNDDSDISPLMLSFGLSYGGWSDVSMTVGVLAKCFCIHSHSV